MRKVALALALLISSCGEDDALTHVEEVDAGPGADAAASPDVSEPHDDDASTAADAGGDDSWPPDIIPDHGTYGIRAVLIWDHDRPDRFTDVDLHLLHPNGEHWFAGPWDCYFANTNPSWDRTATTSPWLDHDVVAGHGPETIRLREIPHEQYGRAYRVGVHFWSAHFQHGPSIIYVQVFCGGTALAQFGPVPMNENDIWRVADVTVYGDFCTIDPVRTSSAAYDITNGDISR